MAVDKPNINLTLAAVRKEATGPEAFKVALSASKIITFPDLYEMESAEAEEIFGKLNRNATNWTVLDLWLSKADAAALRAEKLTLRQLARVVQTAVTYYEGNYGNAGEGDASEG